MNPEINTHDNGQVVPFPSVILATGARYMLPTMVLFSFFLLLRGHNLPGGGFVGGLTAAAAFALFAIAHGVQRAQQLLRVDPLTFIGVGLLVAVLSGLPGLATGRAFMTGLWLAQELPAIGKVGTPVLFDTGVYLVVMGITLLIVFTLAEE